MKWIKSPPALVALFDAAVARLPNAERKTMFGYPSLFIKGNLTAGLFQDRVMFRLSEKDREEFLRDPGHREFEPMPGRPMKEYVEAPGSTVGEGGKLERWLSKAVSHAESLKPKARKPAKKRGASK
jgi:TfoX/Sxy family transcriptional regulator of competence genes